MAVTASSLWSTAGPATWPAPTSRMSVSRLLDGEVCPRRAALRAADYSSIWDGRGYPPRFSLPAFTGEVVHLALADIAEELRRCGCKSVQEPGAVEAIKSMGGYTKIAEVTAEKLLRDYAKNPRFVAQQESALYQVRAGLSELRRRTQSLMCQLRVGAVQKTTGVGGGERKRVALLPGVYSEVWLEVPEMGWAGRADQIIISDLGAEITELKTGELEPHHSFQLAVYALLWSRDRALNPSGRRPVALRLHYLNRSHQLPVPSSAKMNDFATDLAQRTTKVLAELSSRPPVARYQHDECRRCDVRQLCDEYWTRLQSSKVSPTGSDWCDVEAVIVGRHGHLSFDARIVCGEGVASGSKALIRVQGSREFRAGENVRILGAFVSCDDDMGVQTTIVRVGSLSEVFHNGQTQRDLPAALS